MKHWLSFFIGLFFTVACGSKSAAQTHTFSFYSASSGLPSSEIISLAQDDQGFLWVGTVAGLSRYNGYTFTNYQYSAGDYLLGMVNVIRPAGGGSVWIGASSGLYHFSHNRLVKISAETNSQQGINDILIEPDGIWLATENGPAYILKKELATGASPVSIDKHVLPAWKINNLPLYERRATHIKKATDGTVYCATNYSIYRVTSKGTEIVFSLKDKSDLILTLLPVDKDKVFFDCARSELNKVEKGIWSLLNFKDHYQPGAPAGDQGFWYAGTVGIFYLDPVTEKIAVFINTLDHDLIWPSCLLKVGDIFWLGTHDALVKVTPSVFKDFTNVKYSVVKEAYSFTRLKDGQLLIGTNRGKLWQKKEEEFVYFLRPGQQMVPTAELKCLFEDERGRLWAGSGYQGITVYDKGVIKNLTREQHGLHDNTIECFFKTTSGRFFAIGDQGLSEIFVDEKETVSFKRYYCLPNASRDAKFFAAVEGPGGIIWLAGEEGIMYLDNDSLKAFQLLNKKIAASCIRKAQDGSVWVATEGQGIFQCSFDAGNKLVIQKQYHQRDGLNTELFIDLLVDRQDNIWAGSARGISFIGRNGPYKSRVLNFGEEDGFIRANYSSIRLYQDNDGVIWAGTTHGITSFNPADLFLPAERPKVYITGIGVMSAGGQVQQSDSVFSQSDHTALPYPNNSNSFNFSFTAIDFAHQQSVQYYYKLDGVDSAWINAEHNRNVTYQNLVPGQYTFRVKAMNDKGIISDREALYAFAIAPPFWQTWWFRIAGLIVAAAIVVVFIKRRESIAREKEAEKTAVEKLKATSYRYQLEIEQVINYFATSINQQSTVDEMLWDVARNCISKLGFEDCVIYLLDDERNVLLQKAAWGPKTTAEDKIVNPIEIPVGSGIVGHVALSGRPEINNDTSADARYIVDDASRLSEITVPIRNDKKVLGIIDSEHTQKNFYTDRHLTILSTIASLLAGKIEKMVAVEQKREREIEVLKLNKDLATWQINALRAQMNPHFIFNAMNSIQQFTLKNDTGNANLYISRFSTLLRKVLHSSQQNYITLEEEMEQLNLYLDIEKLRIGMDFEYTITAAGDIETDALKMPGMLIQPFVENAVKHGLSLKEGQKKLRIYFRMPDEFHLEATIADNGIGRQRSAQLKQQQTLMPHESKGIQLVEERLQLLDQGANHQSFIHIEDLASGSGTKVTLLIPVG